jgi:UDP-N-acetylglucosamine 2-epimerase
VVLRKETERPEGCLAGVAALVGDDPPLIAAAVAAAVARGRGRGSDVYGDGAAAARIVSALSNGESVCLLLISVPPL